MVAISTRTFGSETSKNFFNSFVQFELLKTYFTFQPQTQKQLLSFFYLVCYKLKNGV